MNADEQQKEIYFSQRSPKLNHWVCFMVTLHSLCACKYTNFKHQKQIATQDSLSFSSTRILMP